jgi:hypothetical protein
MNIWIMKIFMKALLIGNKSKKGSSYKNNPPLDIRINNWKKTRGMINLRK